MHLATEALPRCIVIDEHHRVVMECSARPGRPLDAHYFAPAESPTRLPGVLDRAVEVLELNCVAEQTTSKSASFGSYSIKVQLIKSGPANLTTIVIDRAKAA